MYKLKLQTVVPTIINIIKYYVIRYINKIEAFIRKNLLFSPARRLTDRSMPEVPFAGVW